MLGIGAYVCCSGKARKERCAPLRKDTVRALRAWLRRHAGEPSGTLFPHAGGGPHSRDGVEYLLAKYVTTAAEECPALRAKRISPHALRRSAVMTLLQHGVDRLVDRALAWS